MRGQACCFETVAHQPIKWFQRLISSSFDRIGLASLGCCLASLGGSGGLVSLRGGLVVPGAVLCSRWPLGGALVVLVVPGVVSVVPEVGRALATTCLLPSLVTNSYPGNVQDDTGTIKLYPFKENFQVDVNCDIH